MTAAKKKTSGLASHLIADRFSEKIQPGKYIQRSSITEFTPLLMLNEKLTMENKIISNSKYAPEDRLEIVEKYRDLIDGLDNDLSIPHRVPHELVEIGDFKMLENFVFNRWKLHHNEKIFERNIEVWRQLWIACERSETIAQIVDARNPLQYFNEDLLRCYSDKKHLILINKTDLVGEVDIEGLKDRLRVVYGDQINKSIEVYAYSARQVKFDFNLSGTVGLIGYPNVGKSSTINMILRQKKVKVSATPGKTKTIQTIETPNFTLLDCPGLIFPRYSKIELVLMGILNVDHISDLHKYSELIMKHIGIDLLTRFYKLSDVKNDFLNAMSLQKGWVKSKCLKMMTKDYAMGEMATKVIK